MRASSRRSAASPLKRVDGRQAAAPAFTTRFKPLPSCHYCSDTFDHEMECTEFHIDAILAFIARESGAEVQEVLNYVGYCTQRYARTFIEALNILFGEYRWDAYQQQRVDDVPYIYSKTGRWPGATVGTTQGAWSDEELTSLVAESVAAA